MGRQGTEPLEKVSELIDHDSATWKVDVVRRNFLSPDADAILNIPLRRSGGEDFVAWALEKSGEYSVKSAYRALVTHKESLTQGEGVVASTSSSDTQKWTALWKLKVIPRVRVFWWRVLRGILPDYSTLKHHHIKQIARCDLCQAMDEDLQHALLQCSHAQQYWTVARDLFHLKIPPLHPTTWAADILLDR